MCGRFTLTTDTAELVEHMLRFLPGADFAQQYRPRYNIAPMQRHWIVTPQREERIVQPATWGLVNFWEKDRRAGAKAINARAETVDSRPTFREAFKTGRCLVPANGFFEWTGEKDTRRPFWFHRPDDQPFAFAGLYQVARLAGEVEPTTTFTIITTEPNAVTSRVHDRMPVILPDDDAAAAWLYPEQDAEALKSLLRPVDDRFLVARAVSTRANSVRNDDPSCLDEDEPELQGSLL